MGCNCKKVTEFQEKYGEEQQESYFGKFARILKRLCISILVILLMLISVPIIIIILSCQLLFGKTMGIRVPKKILEKIR